MKVKYCKLEPGNFGDELNVYIWPKLIPELINQNDLNYLIGIGTILGNKYNNLPGKKLVFTSGTGYEMGAIIDNTWDIVGVRGKKTAELYGLSPNKVLCDGAYLLRKILNCKDFSHGKKVGFMPHHSSIEFFDWKHACEELGLIYISPQLPLLQILEDLKGCNRIICEAMHGAIVADALRIPWCAVSYSPSFLKFKWDDWASVLDIDAVIHPLPFIVRKNFSKKTLCVYKMKRFIGLLGLGKQKWCNFPIINLKNQDEKLLFNELENLINIDRFQLSSDETMIFLDNKLDIALKYLKQNYSIELIQPQFIDATGQLRLDPQIGILYGTTNADNAPEFL